MGKGSSGRGASGARATLNTQREHKSVVDLLNDSKYSDGTYDISNLRQIEYDHGYQVTFCQIGDNYSRAEYADKVNEFLNVSSDGKTLAGKFQGTPEISFHVNDLQTALALARKYNQISIWDWANDTDISTGGTGRRR